MADNPKKYIVTDGELVLELEAAEEGGYLVTSPFDPDVLTEAETLEEAFVMARDVIQTYKDYRASLEQPTGKPAKVKKRTGKPSRAKKTA